VPRDKVFAVSRLLRVSKGTTFFVILLSSLLFNVHIRTFRFTNFIHECRLIFLTYITVN
jgi:hypothetical protein